MEMKVLSALEGLRFKEGSALKDALIGFLTEHTADEPVTIRKARDTFSLINRRAKRGHAQIIKDSSGEETIILSVKDLAAMIDATMNGITLADALDASGFKPVKGERLVIEEGLRNQTEPVLEMPEAESKRYEEAKAL